MADRSGEIVASLAKRTRCRGWCAVIPVLALLKGHHHAVEGLAMSARSRGPARSARRPLSPALGAEPWSRKAGRAARVRRWERMRRANRKSPVKAGAGGKGVDEKHLGDQLVEGCLAGRCARNRAVPPCARWSRRAIAGPAAAYHRAVNRQPLPVSASEALRSGPGGCPAGWSATSLPWATSRLPSARQISMPHHVGKGRAAAIASETFSRESKTRASRLWAARLRAIWLPS